MESSFPGKLRVWEGATAAVVPDLTPSPGVRPPQPVEAADRLYAWEAFVPPRPARDTDSGAEPYSLQWFLNIENRRFSRRGRWIPHLLEFTKHAGETLLGLGNGLGTDWVQYARHGASVVVCCPSGPQLALIRRNFELRGLGGRFLQAPPAALPLDSASIDVACLSGWFQDVEQPREVVDEVFRVLKPGGKVLVVSPARYNIDFWYRTCFFWQRWLKRRPETLPFDHLGGGRGFTARRLRRLFHGFVDHRIHKRQLRRSEVPHIWRWAPLSVLERLMGRVLVLKAFKPLSTALPVAVAA